MGSQSQLHFPSLFLVFLLFTTTPTTSINAFSSSTPPNLVSHCQSVLTHLGYVDLAKAIPDVFGQSPSINTWNGPLTIFLPPEDMITSLMAPSILLEGSVPGAYSYDDLVALPIGTALQTLSYGRCLRVGTIRNAVTGTASAYVNEVFIQRADMLNSGTLIVHGLASPLNLPLLPTSCGEDLMNVQVKLPPLALGRRSFPQSFHMEMCLRDAMARLSSNGYTVLGLVMERYYGELMKLDNVTVLGVEDTWCFGDGGPSFAYTAKYHMIPNRYLDNRGLKELGQKTTLPTLGGIDLEVVKKTAVDSHVSINYEHIKKHEVIKNSKVVVHLLPRPLELNQVRKEYRARLEDNLPWMIASSDSWETYKLHEAVNINDKKTQVFKAASIKQEL